MNKKLLLSALLVATQNLNIVAQQNNEPSELGVDVMITDNQLEISINFNESFRWENTKYDSIKKFDMRGGGKMPHTINFDDSNNLRWRQTDVVFIGTFQIKQISAEELLAQYIEKHGGFGIRTWSIDNKSGGMRSFNEFTGSYEVLTLKEFADRFMLVSALFPCNPSNKARPPSSISRFKRTLTLSNESLTLSARPKYLPPCKTRPKIPSCCRCHLCVYLVIG